MLRRKKGFIQALICISFLFATPLLISAPAVLHGASPLDLDLVTSLTPWQEARTPGLDLKEDARHASLIERYYPWYAFINLAGVNGELPLWNPFEGFGTPFLALWRTRALSPFSVPFYFFSLPAALGVSVFLKLFIAGLCAYYAARRFHFTPPFALLTALTFQLSGPLLVGHWHPISDLMPWFPLLLPCMQRLLLGEYRVWPYIALLVGILTLGGDPESLLGTVLFILLLIPVYSLRTYQRSHAVGAMGVFAASVSLGLALAGVQLVPYIEFTRLGTLETQIVSQFRLADISAILAPLRAVNREAAYGASLWLPSGTIAFLLLPLWVSVRPHANRARKRRLESLLFAALLLMAIGPLLASLITRLTGLPRMGLAHFMLPFPLACGFLVATAADEWVHLDADKCKSALKQLVWLLPIMWGGAFVGAYMLTRGVTNASGAPTDAFRLSVMVAAALLALLIITLLWPRSLFMSSALTALTFCFLWFTHTPLDTFTPAARVFPETQFVRSLQQQDSRVAGSSHLQYWPLSVHQIGQTYSPSGATLYRSQSFLSEAEQRPELLRLSGCKALLLTKQDVQGGFASLRSMLNIQEVFPSGAILLRDLQARPRARIAHAGRAAETPPPSALRVGGPPLLEGGTLPSAIKDGATSTAIITDESLNRIVVSTTTSRPGVLTLADAWYPGWQVAVEDNAADIFPVDIAFRGVEISEGQHEVVFTYQPFSLRLGFYMSLAASLLIFIGLRSLYRHRRHRH